MNLIRNEEERARGLNPLERVIAVKENGHGGIVISTTNEKLAQRIGRSVKKAFHGEVAYHWSHDTKLVRVEWERAA
jgi:pyridoxine/pyridoxamine 5'-phosphate oxidase